MLEETEAEETKDFFCQIFVISDISIGRGRDPWLRLCAGQFVLEIRKLLATSKAEFNSLVGASVGSKPEVESRTQGSRPRPRTQKKSEAKAKDSLSEDRHSRGQGQECSRPRPRTKDTSASALQKKKKVFTKIFQAISTKKRFPKNFSSALKILTIQKIVLSSSRGLANFRGLEASRPRT